MKPVVIVAKGENPYQTTTDALRGLPPLDLRRRKVLIKPNAARVASPGQGITTHPLVVEATIDYLREKGASDIVIGESCIFGVNPEEAFRVTGMKEVSQKKGVNLIDLDQSRPLTIKIPEGKMIKKIKVPSIIKEFDFIISIPLMKTHMHTRVTLSIKNMKGLLWRKEKARLHQLDSCEEPIEGCKGLDIAISEMASVLFPNLAIIDGTVGMEGMGPAYGKTKEAGMIVAGHNGLSTDAVAARLMGFDPESIPHLRLSAKRGLGVIQLENILIKPKHYLNWITPFDPPPSRPFIFFPDIVVNDEGSCSACLSTLLVFLQSYHSALNDYRLGDGKIHIGIGKHLSRCPKGTILIGNCVSRLKRNGTFVRGCPPVSSQILDTLSKEKREIR